VDKKDFRIKATTSARYALSRKELSLSGAPRREFPHTKGQRNPNFTIQDTFKKPPKGGTQNITAAFKSRLKAGLKHYFVDLPLFVRLAITRASSAGSTGLAMCIL
jgi:hypothetical protein